MRWVRTLAAFVRSWPRRWSLRTRLVAGVLLVAGLGLLAASLAATALLTDRLTDEIDDELRADMDVLSQIAPSTRIDRQLRSDVSDEALKGYVLQVRNPDGGVVRSSSEVLDKPAHLALPDLDLDQARRLSGEPFEVDASTATGETDYRVMVGLRSSGRGSVVLAYDLTSRNETVRSLVQIEIAVSLTVLALLGLLGIVVVRTGLRPLDDVETTAEAIITGGDLSRRIPGSPDAKGEIGRLTATLNTMLAEIDDAFGQRADSEARLRRFVADASHELRTPLSGILGLAELYRQGVVTDADEVRRLVGRIEAEARRMGLLVEDLLLLARLDQERPLDRRPVDVVPIVADAVEAARLIDSDRPLDLVIVPEGGSAPVPDVLGDEARLRQVAQNLVDNALTHTPPGATVIVRVGRVEPGDGEPAVLIEVADRGPGLTPEQAALVFERFYRADPARRRRADERHAGGAGLGLSIVAAIVAAHDGRVEYATTEGGGATFRVLLPIAAMPS